MSNRKGNEMGLTNLENKIRENKAFFDEDLPTGHLERFQNKLEHWEKPANQTKGFLFRSKKSYLVAASVSIFILVSAFILLETKHVQSQPQLSEDILHVKMFYSQQTSEKMSEIKNCTQQSPESELLIENTENRLLKLDENTLILEQKLSQAQGNEQLKTAYIQSLKAKSDAVDNIYSQLCTNQSNKSIIQ